MYVVCMCCVYDSSTDLCMQAVRSQVVDRMIQDKVVSTRDAAYKRLKRVLARIVETHWNVTTEELEADLIWPVFMRRHCSPPRFTRAEQLTIWPISGIYFVSNPFFFLLVSCLYVSVCMCLSE